MGEIVGRRRQHDLDQARHLDLSQRVAVVDQRDAAHLDVVLGGDRDLEAGLDAVVGAREYGVVGAEGHPVPLGLAAHRLVGGRPEQAAAHVAKVDELTPRVAGGVVPVPGDRAPAPAAGPASGVGDHRGVLAVRQEVGARVERVRRAEAPRRDRGDERFGPGRLRGARPDHRHEARHALLQQRLGGLHAGIRMEAAHHRGAEHGVGQRDQAHALVMGEEGAHAMPPGRIGHGLAVGRFGPARRVVAGLAEPEAALGALAGEPAEVGRGGGGVD